MPVSDHTNFALSTLASPPSSTDGTELTVGSGHGALFPSTPFNVTVWPAGVQPTSSNAEIMRVTAKASDVFTVTRAQEGTSARTFAANDQIAATPTARVFTDVEYGAHGVVNVMDPTYGAVGDGSTDDTAAIQAAIDVVEALSGGELYFPKGTFKVTAELTVTQPMVIHGAGRGVAIIRATTLGASKGVLKLTASNITIRDLTIRGPSVATYVSDECGVWAYGTSGSPVTDIVIENCEVYDIGSYGILFEYANRSRAVRNYVHDVGYGGIANLSSADFIAAENLVSTITPGTSSNAYGLFVTKRLTGDTTPSRGTMSKNVVKDVALWEGIDTHGATFYTINDNVVSGCKIGIQVGPDSFGNVPHFTTICNNAIDNGALTTTQLRGISIGGNGSTNVRGIVCKGNTIDTMGGADGSSGLLAAILIQYTIGSICDGNTLYAAEQNGIIYDGGGNVGIVCTNNAIHGVTLRTGNASGIRFNTATSGVCTGNYIDASDNYPMYFNVSCPSLRMDDTNVFITDGTAPASGIIVVNPANAGRGYTMYGTATADLGNLVDADGTTISVTVTGAALGDTVTWGCSVDVQDMSVTAAVSATNTVKIRVQNETTGAIDLASATWTARVVRS